MADVEIMRDDTREVQLCRRHNFPMHRPNWQDSASNESCYILEVWRKGD